MTDAIYTQIFTVFMIGVLVPAWALVVMLKPRPFIYVFRGRESSVCLAIALEFSRRLVIVLTGADIPFPGNYLALFNIVILTIVALLLWGRVSQFLRHRARNKQMSSSKWLVSQGIDPDEIKRLKEEQK